MELTRVTATGTVKTTGAIVKLVILIPAAAATTLVLRDGGAGGTVKLSLQAPISGQSVPVPMPDGVTFATDIHATLVGAAAEAFVGY